MESVVIVTGASRGIGAAIAERLAGQGHVVACLSRSGGLPDRPSARPQDRERWLPLRADVTDTNSVRRAFAEACDGRRLVGLVNNAGLHRSARAHELSLAEWDAMLAANATSVLVGCQSAFPHFTDDGGLIVNIGSFFDKIGVKQNLAYCAAKAAVGAMTRVLAVEWAARKIGVMNVAPGYIVTDLNRDAMSAGPLRAYLDKRIPGGAPGDENDVASLVAALFAMDRRFLTGETIYVDGGQGIAH